MWASTIIQLAVTLMFNEMLHVQAKVVGDDDNYSLDVLNDTIKNENLIENETEQNQKFLENSKQHKQHLLKNNLQHSLKFNKQNKELMEEIIQQNQIYFKKKKPQDLNLFKNDTEQNYTFNKQNNQESVLLKEENNEQSENFKEESNQQNQNFFEKINEPINNLFENNDQRNQTFFEQNQTLYEQNNNDLNKGFVEQKQISLQNNSQQDEDSNKKNSPPNQNLNQTDNQQSFEQASLPDKKENVLNEDEENYNMEENQNELRERQTFTRKAKVFNFQKIVKYNKQYSRVADKCSNQTKPVGRQMSKRGELPYQVAIRRSSYRGTRWRMFCGGAIVTVIHVLSAAHCFSNGKLTNIRVIAATTTPNIKLPKNRYLKRKAMKEVQRVERWRSVKSCHQHEEYNLDDNIHDIAVLVLKYPFVFTSTVKAVPMLASNEQKPVNTLCLVSGYGLIANNRRARKLQKGCVVVVPDTKCQNAYISYFGDTIQVCASSQMKETCSGDAGGPLVCNGVLTGILSYGDRRCDKFPAAYTLLSGYTGGKNILFWKCHAARVNYNILEMIIALALLCIL